jgi:DNA-binding transcriptional ArsR family regulator
MDRNRLVSQLKALGEPTRLALCQRLARREWAGIELQEELGISQPNLSRHLRVLREAGLVVERREGRRAFFRLEEEELASAVLRLAAGLPLGLPAAAKYQSISMHTSIKPSSGDDSRGPSGPPTAESQSIEEWLL